MPWQRCDEHGADTVKVEEMLLLVDVMLENTSADAQQVDFSYDFGWSVCSAGFSWFQEVLLVDFKP